MNARAAAMAPAIGAPRMLSDASISTIAPLDLALLSTARLVTGCPFSVTVRLAAVSAVATGVR
jgi:hypothetical protein